MINRMNFGAVGTNKANSNSGRVNFGSVYIEESSFWKNSYKKERFWDEVGDICEHGKKYRIGTDSAPKKFLGIIPRDNSWCGSGYCVITVLSKATVEQRNKFDKLVCAAAEKWGFNAHIEKDDKKLIKEYEKIIGEEQKKVNKQVAAVSEAIGPVNP